MLRVAILSLVCGVLTLSGCAAPGDERQFDYARTADELGLRADFEWFWGTGHIGPVSFNATGTNGRGRIFVDPDISGRPVPEVDVETFAKTAGAE